MVKYAAYCQFICALSIYMLHMICSWGKYGKFESSWKFYIISYMLGFEALGVVQHFDGELKSRIKIFVARTDSKIMDIGNESIRIQGCITSYIKYYKLIFALFYTNPFMTEGEKLSSSIQSSEEPLDSTISSP